MRRLQEGALHREAEMALEGAQFVRKHHEQHDVAGAQ